MGTHTPGPWRVVNCDVRPTERDDGCRLFDIRAGEVVNSPYGLNVTGAIDCGGVSVAMVDLRNREANARLIAAAPELLEALNLAVAALERELASLLDSVCLKEDGVPIRSTAEPGALPDVQRLEEALGTARTAIAKARGASA